MNIGRIEGSTRVLGKTQGYLGLPVRDARVACSVAGSDVHTMTTAWFPSPDELAAINAGAAIHVELQAAGHPPIMLGVGPVPE